MKRGIYGDLLVKLKCAALLSHQYPAVFMCSTAEPSSC